MARSPALERIASLGVSDCVAFLFKGTNSRVTAMRPMALSRQSRDSCLFGSPIPKTTKLSLSICVQKSRYVSYTVLDLAGQGEVITANGQLRRYALGW